MILNYNIDDPEWIYVKSFPHNEGQHCDSSTLRDHLEFHDHPFSEAMIFGLGATMGFGFFCESENPYEWFVGGKTDTFTENELTCRILGFTIEKQTFPSPKLAWEDAKKLIQTNKPLFIQGDMAYLDYFWNDENLTSDMAKLLGTPKDDPLNQENMHFGGHSFSLVGYNDVQHTALIADNNYQELIPIQMESLERARNSKEGWKGMWPHNVRYLIEPRADGKHPPFPAGVKLALSTYVRNMKASSTNNQGLGAMKKFLSKIDEWKKLSSTNPKEFWLFLYLFYGYIEEFGTGGSMFRKLYQTFLKELHNSETLIQGPRAWTPSEFNALENAIGEYEVDINSWMVFSNHIAQDLIQTKDRRDFQGYSLDIDTYSDEMQNIITSETKITDILQKIRL